jgi:hypothetical protein
MIVKNTLALCKQANTDKHSSLFITNTASFIDDKHSSLVLVSKY